MESDLRRWIRLVETIDQDTRLMYQHGRCMFLALALHDLAGWPIYGEVVAANRRIIHAWAMHNGKAVDINGAHPTNFAEVEGPDKRGGNKTIVQQLDPKSLRDRYIGDMPEVLEKTKQMVLANKQYFGIA